MEVNVLHLIDFEKVDILLEGFNKTTGFVTAILDLEGNVLSKSGWRKICIDFHRINHQTVQNCKVSDTTLAGQVASGEKYHFYKCLNGLVDVAIPIVIKGKHIANLFTGQFFFEKPDYSFFSAQAKKYGFDEKEYLEALKEVPVVSQEKVKIAMEFLLDMTELIAGMAMQRLEQDELNTAIKVNEKSKSDLLEKLNEAQKVASIGSWEWNLKTKEVWWSDETYRIFEALRGSFLPDFEANAKFVHPDDLEKYTAKFEHSLNTGDKLNCEFRLVVGNKKIKYCTAKGNVIFDKAGSAEKFVGTIEDNTAYKLTQFEKQESEKLYRSLFDNMLNGFAYCQMHFDENGDPYDFTYLSVNAAFESQTGLKNVEGKKVSIVIPGIKESDPKLFELYGRVAKTGIPERFEFFVESLNMWFSLSAYCPEIGYFVAVFDVITERKKAEEALRESETKYKGLFNSVHDALLITDINRDIIDCNPAFTELFGFTLNEVKGKQTSFFYEDEEQFRAFGNELNEHLDSNIPIQNITNYKKKNGEIFPGETGIHYLKNNMGETVAYIGWIRDITQRIKAEKEIKTLNEELEQKVIKRTRELEKKYLEVERINKLFVDRELRMIELKNIIKDLEAKIEEK